MSEHPAIPNYERMKLLGRNGHLTYLARQSSTGRLVRLNVVHSSGDFGQMVADKLRREAQLLATLHHPNIVQLVEVGDAQGYGFFSALEYVDGFDLAETALNQSSPHYAEIVRIARLVASALDYVHGLNIVHGDLHPKNILLDRTGHVFLSGFADVRPESPETICFGNPHFLAPEQLDGLDNTVPQSDVYALAEVVFLLLSGSYPYQGAEGIERLLKRKRSGSAPSIRGSRPELPRKVDLTLQQAMAVRPEDRFRTAEQFVEKLAWAFGLCQEGRKAWWQFWR